MLKSLLAGVQGIYNNKLRTPDRSMFTDDIAWSTLRLAWADSDYWLRANELLLIGCHLGPEVKIYFHRTLSDGDDFFELISERRKLPPLEASVHFQRVMLETGDKGEGMHYSRILTETTWN